MGCGGPWRSRAGAFSLHLDLGLGALKVPKEAEEGGRATSGSARKGKRQHSSPQNTLLDCSLCGKVFSSASSLSKHYLTHSQERKHVCKICSKAFKRQDHLCVGAGPGRLLGGWGRAWASAPLPSAHTPPCGGPQGCAACAQAQTGLELPGFLGPDPHGPSPQIHSREESAAALGRQDPGGLKTHPRGSFVLEGIGLTLCRKIWSRCLKRTDLCSVRDMHRDKRL